MTDLSPKLEKMRDEALKVWMPLAQRTEGLEPVSLYLKELHAALENAEDELAGALAGAQDYQDDVEHHTARMTEALETAHRDYHVPTSRTVPFGSAHCPLEPCASWREYLAGA